MAAECCTQLCGSGELVGVSKAAQVHFELSKINPFGSFLMF